jgi:hypothetical protein
MDELEALKQQDAAMRDREWGRKDWIALFVMWVVGDIALAVFFLDVWAALAIGTVVLVGFVVWYVLRGKRDTASFKRPPRHWGR